MRRIARVDANQPAIVAALRKAGAFVQPLHQVGKGCPDLLVGFRGVWRVMEAKDSHGTMTPDEEFWQSKAWHIARCDTCLARSSEDALRAIGAM